MAHSHDGLDHRFGQRGQLDLPVLVQVSALHSAEVDACIKNLSLSGALMHVDFALRLHALIEVRIELPDPWSPAAVLDAYVLRKLTRGVGIEWCDFAPHIIKGLLRSTLVRFPH